MPYLRDADRARLRLGSAVTGFLFLSSAAGVTASTIEEVVVTAQRTEESVQ
jgi:hypothetical protein